MLILTKRSISLYDAGKNEILCQSKVLYPLVHACYKDMLQHRSKHHPIVWTWRNRSKLNSISLWYSLAQYHIYSKNGCIATYFYQTESSQLIDGFVLVVHCCLMCKLGYVPYTHKTWSQKFCHNTYLYIDLQLLRLKTKIGISRCFKWLIFYIVQNIRLTKRRTPTKTRTLSKWD